MPFRRRKTPRDAAAAPGEHQEPPGQKRSPLSGRVARSFGIKCAWLAIRSQEPQEVARTLQLQRVKSTAWPDGLAAVDAHPQKQSLRPGVHLPRGRRLGAVPVLVRLGFA